MKCYFNCVASVVAVIALQLCAATVADAQTYQDILKQVSTPGFVDSKSASPSGSELPTIDTVFGRQTSDSPAPRVPSAIVNNNEQPNKSAVGASNSKDQATGGSTYHFMESGQDCNPPIPLENSSGTGAAGSGTTLSTDVNCGVPASTVMQPGNIYSPTYSAPVYVPGQHLGSANEITEAPNCEIAPAANVAADYVENRAVGGRNLVFGVYGLVFDRDYEDDVSLVCNDVGQVLRSTDADVGDFGGVEFFMGTRNSNGYGIDVRYWGLFTNEANYTLTGSSFTSHIPALSNVTWPNNGRTILDVINGSTSNNIHRDNEIHNVEVNMLRNAGCFTTCRGRIASYELLAGFRWFEFDETFHWDIASPSAPTSLYFDHNVKNTLLGFQLGGLTEFCLTERIRFNAGTKVGLFNNRVRAEQILQNELGEFASVDGSAYYFRNSKNDFSMLGELNVAFAYHYNPCSRLTIGYRAIGVSGIALGPNQLNNFNYLGAITNIQSNADLLLHGTFFGFEFCR